MLERMWGEKRFYSLVGVVCKLARQLWKSIGRIPPSQLKLEFPCDPATPLLGTCTDDGIPHREDITHPCALLALSEYPGKGVSRDVHQHAPRRIRKMWDLYTMEFYSFARKKIPHKMCRKMDEHAKYNAEITQG